MPESTIPQRCFALKRKGWGMTLWRRGMLVTVLMFVAVIVVVAFIVVVVFIVVAVFIVIVVVFIVID